MPYAERIKKRMMCSQCPCVGMVGVQLASSCAHGIQANQPIGIVEKRTAGANIQCFVNGTAEQQACHGASGDPIDTQVVVHARTGTECCIDECAELGFSCSARSVELLSRPAPDANALAQLVARAAYDAA